MADQDLNNRGNGGGGDASLPQAATLAQYIKDLSVESPNAPLVFQWQAQPQLDVQFNINVDRVGDDMHEVVLKIEVGARSEQGVHFLIDLSYGGLFALRNVPEDAVGPFLLVEAPRLLFPFMRQIVADCSQQTGFPPLLLDPIDFGAAYMAQLQAQEQGQNGAAGAGSEGNGDDSTAEPSDETPQS
ncbi:MAG TPA: protein-export chaperone SecB [Sphingomicrobium sp.]|nr:protein-export chaperone SecB [Sphingomicrobium sp.]